MVVNPIGEVYEGVRGEAGEVCISNQNCRGSVLFICFILLILVQEITVIQPLGVDGEGRVG